MEKILKTRISQLKKTLAEWELIKDTFIPYYGELCIVDDNGNIKFKVGDGQSFFKDLPFVGGDTNVIESISVNNVQQTITNKNVNIDLTDYALANDIPTAVSELTNDSEFQTASDVIAILANEGDPYQTESDVSSAIATALSNSGDTYQTASDVQNYVTSQGFITNAVNNLTNYYLKSELYTKSEIDNLISAISTMSLEVVQTLPTEDISTTTIYLLSKQSAGTQNVYDEYIYLNNSWELIGSTEIDLSNYYTKTEVDNAIDGATGTIESELNAKQDTLVSGTSIKTINNQSLLGSGDISIQSGDTNVIETVKVNNAPLTPDANKAVNIDLSGYATTSALSNKQDTLVSGTNIKTINNESLLGSGNIDIDNIFIATYDVTTFEDINTAISENKVILVVYDSQQFISGGISYNQDNISISTPSFGAGNYVFSIDDTDTWQMFVNNAIPPINNPIADDLVVVDENGDLVDSGVKINELQEKLVSGTNIKTINNTSLLGSGNIIVGGDTNVIEAVKVNNSALTPDANKAVNIDLSSYATETWVQNYVANLDGNNTGY